jgi:hypothetical protein
MDESGKIVGFLRGIGIEVEQRAGLGDTFLPGLTLDRGRLLFDPAKLEYPGDLLHEAGHVAVAPRDVRPLLSGSVDVPGVDMGELETAVVPWSYAAALEIGIDPALVFHAGGYRGKSAGLLTTFGAGVYPGLPLLEAYGLAAGPRLAATLGVPAYPAMISWLRPDQVRDEAAQVVRDQPV